MELTFKHNGEIVAVVKPTGHVRWMPNSVVIPEELQAAVRLASQQQRERPEKLKSDYFLWGYLMANIGKDKDSNVNQSIVIDFECVGGESEADLIRMADDWLDEYWAEMNEPDGERQLRLHEERCFQREVYDYD